MKGVYDQSHLFLRDSSAMSAALLKGLLKYMFIQTLIESQGSVHFIRNLDPVLTAVAVAKSFAVDTISNFSTFGNIP